MGTFSREQADVVAAGLICGSPTAVVELAGTKVGGGPEQRVATTAMYNPAQSEHKEKVVPAFCKACQMRAHARALREHVVRSWNRRKF